jgi:nitrite reductase/ring-hydroxylating ferredoxin subunit
MQFVKVAQVGDIPDGYGRLLEVDGRVIAVFNHGGRFHATSPVCPHEDGPLADGWIEGDAVVCPWHGFDFDLASGRCLSDPDLAISVYRARVTGTAVEVDLG